MQHVACNSVGSFLAKQGWPQHCATWWPNACNMLRATMLHQHVASVWPGSLLPNPSRPRAPAPMVPIRGDFALLYMTIWPFAKFYSLGCAFEIVNSTNCLRLVEIARSSYDLFYPWFSPHEPLPFRTDQSFQRRTRQNAAERQRHAGRLPAEGPWRVPESEETNRGVGRLPAGN